MRLCLNRDSDLASLGIATADRGGALEENNVEADKYGNGMVTLHLLVLQMPVELKIVLTILRRLGSCSRSRALTDLRAILDTELQCAYLTLTAFTTSQMNFL